MLHKPSGTTRLLKGYMGILKVAFAGIVVVSVIGGFMDAMNPKAEKIPDSPEVIAKKALDEVHFQEVVRAAKSIKYSTKNPASFKLESAYRTTEGVVCMTYRGTNSFNAVVLGYASSSKGVINTGDGSWTKSCAKKTGQDFSYARAAL